MGKKRYLAGLLAGAAVVLTGPMPAAGQEDGPGGLVMTFGISSSLRINDNFGLDPTSPGTTTLLDNRLSFGLLSETDVSRLQLDLEGTLRFADTPGSSQAIDFDKPRAALNYVREGANSRFSADAEYQRSDLDFDDPLRLIEELDEDDLVIDSGTREDLNLNLALDTGLNDPLGFGLVIDHKSRRYSDTTDPGLSDSDNSRVEASARLRFSAVTEGRLTLSQTEYSAEDANLTERTTQELKFGLTHALSPVTTLEASLGYTDIEERLTAVPSMSGESGISGSLELTRELVNGTVGIAFESDVTITGRRSTLSVSRALDLPRGSLAARFGATRTASGDIAAIGSLDYQQELATGTFTAFLSRDYRTSGEGNDIRSTRGRLGYATDLGPLSQLKLDFEYAEVSGSGAGTVDDTDTTRLRATYIHELNADWNLSAGYEHRIRNSAADGRANSNEIFVTLDRTFSIRP